MLELASQLLVSACLLSHKQLWTVCENAPFHLEPGEGVSDFVPAAVEKEGADVELLSVSKSAAEAFPGRLSSEALLLKCLKLGRQLRCNVCDAVCCKPLWCQYQETRLPS